jgi:hypothetical protein
MNVAGVSFALNSPKRLVFFLDKAVGYWRDVCCSFNLRSTYR